MARPVYEVVLERAGVGAGIRYLDVGCGSGMAAQRAAARGAQASGIDAAEALLAIARSRVPESDFRQGDIADLPFADEMFDHRTDRGMARRQALSGRHSRRDRFGRIEPRTRSGGLPGCARDGIANCLVHGDLRGRVRLLPIPNNRTILSSAPRERAGIAGGIVATARLVGQTLGIRPNRSRRADQTRWRPIPNGFPGASLLGGFASLLSRFISRFARLGNLPFDRLKHQRLAGPGSPENRA